ncbi:hypothetical protein ACVWXQ_006680 [Bradyrhizobium sp. S3.14.4]
MTRKATPRNASEYEQFAAEWERRRNDPHRGAANWLVEPAGLPVDPLELVQTLRVLGEITQDPTFAAARVALAGHGLVDIDGKWKRHAILASEPARDVCEAIAEAIAAGVSERQAFAEAAVTLNIAATSFEGAVKRVRLLYLAYKAV